MTGLRPGESFRPPGDSRNGTTNRSAISVQPQGPDGYLGNLKRLAASVNVAGRENGLNRRERAAAVQRAVEDYRLNMNRLESMGLLEIWYLHAYPGPLNPLIKIDPKSKAVFKKVLAKALTTDNKALVPKSRSTGPMDPGCFARIRLY